MQGKTNTMQIKPTADRMIRFPMDGSAGANGGKVVPIDGAEVPVSRYWLRKIRCGDCVQVLKQAAAKKPTPKKPTKKTKKEA